MKKIRLLRLPAVFAALAVLSFALLHQPATALTSTTVPGPAGGAAADGTAVFGTKCVLCHGKNGAGLPNWKAKGQPDFTNAEWQASHSDAQIAEAVKNGKGKYMPAFKAKLSDDEIAAVVARVRAFGKKK
jgi:cbb3-type cytochrome c oxidase subunit III